MKSLFFILISFISVQVVAADGGHGHGEIPVNTIIFQTINVSVLLVGLFILLKKTVIDFFQKRQATFVESANKAQKAREIAEKEKDEITAKLNYLGQTANDSMMRARAEAAEMKKQMIEDAETVSARLKQEAQEIAKFEVIKAQRIIRETLVAEAINEAKSKMSSEVSGEDHSRLQKNFLANIKEAKQ